MRYDSEYYGICSLPLEEYLQHHGIKGQKWGVRRFQNKDGSLTPAGRERYLTDMAEKYNLVDVPKNRDAAWDNAGDMVVARAPKKEVKKYLEVNDLDPKEYGRLKKEMQPYIERQKLRDKTQKSNAKAIEKGNFDLKNDNRAQYLKDEITKTYSDYKKSVDEFEKNIQKSGKHFTKIRNYLKNISVRLRKKNGLAVDGRILQKKRNDGLICFYMKILVKMMKLSKNT